MNDDVRIQNCLRDSVRIICSKLADLAQFLTRYIPSQDCRRQFPRTLHGRSSLEHSPLPVCYILFLDSRFQSYLGILEFQSSEALQEHGISDWDPGFVPQQHDKTVLNGTELLSSFTLHFFISMKFSFLSKSFTYYSLSPFFRFSSLSPFLHLSLSCLFPLF